MCCAPMITFSVDVIPLQECVSVFQSRCVLSVASSMLTSAVRRGHSMACAVTATSWPRMCMYNIPQTCCEFLFIFFFKTIFLFSLKTPGAWAGRKSQLLPPVCAETKIADNSKVDLGFHAYSQCCTSIFP